MRIVIAAVIPVTLSACSHRSSSFMKATKATIHKADVEAKKSGKISPFDHCVELTSRRSRMIARLPSYVYGVGHAHNYTHVVNDWRSIDGKTIMGMMPISRYKDLKDSASIFAHSLLKSKIATGEVVQYISAFQSNPAYPSINVKSDVVLIWNGKTSIQSTNWRLVDAPINNGQSNISIINPEVMTAVCYGHIEPMKLISYTKPEKNASGELVSVAKFDFGYKIKPLTWLDSAPSWFIPKGTNPNKPPDETGTVSFAKTNVGWAVSSISSPSIGEYRAP